MRIIISPAKKMKVDIDTFAYQGLPVFLEETDVLMNWVQALPYAEARKLWGCNDKIAELNYNRFRHMSLKQNLTAALVSYEGIQYQYMAPDVFSQGAWKYVQEHLRILSGFYGVLKPMDGVTPYRLEMQAKAGAGGAKDLYDFWKDKLYKEVRGDGEIIINLASKEYSKCIEKYLTENDRYITCIFGERKEGKIVQKGTKAKMARGEMVRFLAENQIEEPEGIKAFSRLGYQYQEELSSYEEYVFLL